MRRLAPLLLSLLLTTSAWGAEIPVSATGVPQTAIPILITDASGNIVTNTTFTLSDVNLFYACSNQVEAQFNETGDTLTRISSNDGLYWWLTNDALTNCAPPNVMTVYGSGTRLDIPPQTFMITTAAIKATVVASADCTNSATLFDSTLPSFYGGSNGPREAGIQFTSGALANEIRRIGGYNINGCVQVNQAFSGTPAPGDAFVIVKD